MTNTKVYLLFISNIIRWKGREKRGGKKKRIRCNTEVGREERRDLLSCIPNDFSKVLIPLSSFFFSSLSSEKFSVKCPLHKSDLVPTSISILG